MYSLSYRTPKNRKRFDETFQIFSEAYKMKTFNFLLNVWDISLQSGFLALRFPFFAHRILSEKTDRERGG
jgi:hypothetical protein